VTDAVHSENGTTFAQLWHVGPISHSRFLLGHLPVAPSAIRPAGHLSLVRPITPFEIPRVLSLGEVKQIPELFQLATRQPRRRDLMAWSYTARTATCWINSCRVQQTRDLMNNGGSIENRARLMLECTDAVIQEFAAGPGWYAPCTAPGHPRHG
jgi:2,4-dienoyl-CoA reductase-like NADH-dependent reductase (Old Yellow Enzyme family)